MQFKIKFNYKYDEHSVSIYGKDFELLLKDMNEQLPDSIKARIGYDDRDNGELFIEVNIDNIILSKFKPMIECGGSLLEFLFDYKNEEHYILHINTDSLNFWYVQLDN